MIASKPDSKTSFPVNANWLETVSAASLAGMRRQQRIAPETTVVTFDVRSETDAKHALALGQVGTPVAPPAAAPEVDYPAPPGKTSFGIACNPPSLIARAP